MNNLRLRERSDKAFDKRINAGKSRRLRYSEDPGLRTTSDPGFTENAGLPYFPFRIFRMTRTPKANKMPAKAGV